MILDIFVFITLFYIIVLLYIIIFILVSVSILSFYVLRLTSALLGEISSILFILSSNLRTVFQKPDQQEKALHIYLM